MTTERDIRNQIAYARYEGEKVGREEGREEATLTMAKKLKAKGIPIEIIAETTGLSEQEINSL